MWCVRKQGDRVTKILRTRSGVDDMPGEVEGRKQVGTGKICRYRHTGKKQVPLTNQVNHIFGPSLKLSSNGPSMLLTSRDGTRRCT